MDLGISPVITSSMILQALTNGGLLQVDYSIKEDRILYNAAGKLLSLILTFGQAVAQVSGGFYGNPPSMGMTVCFLLVVQLMFSGIIVILLDEMLSKGYGMGSGVNLFIVANLCENIIWRAFSPKVFNTARGIEFEGSIVNTFHLLFARSNKLNAMYEAFFRQNLPNNINLVFTFIIFAIAIYFHGMRVELPVQSTNVKGQTGRWPIKLFYSSTTPIIVQSYIVSHISTISKFFYERYPHNKVVQMLGIWEMNVHLKKVPISGFCYFIFPPHNLLDGLRRPFYFLIYLSFMLLSAAFLSRAWIDVNDLNQKCVAKQMKNQRLTIKGVNENNVESYLDKYIPAAAFTGGIVIGFICVFSNILDTVSGTNIILAVSIVWQYFEVFTKENMKKGGFVMSD